MTVISLHQVSHRYSTHPLQIPAIQEMNYTFKKGTAYALLGPSGCGKTTLLNILSGLITPTRGSVFFDQQEVTQQPTAKRNIAQVFQFPVVYDTMSVFDNLAFPLRNHGMRKDEIKQRVLAVAKMLELSEDLSKKASGLTLDIKQKISLGRGVVRERVNLIMLDEPMTVIDPKLKWNLRTKLKELHRKIGTTLIYVTHDQTEALTFAERVIVMKEGRILQDGTPRELFECPKHSFVGHFIGSPGMNFFPCQPVRQTLFLEKHRVSVKKTIDPNQKYQLGIRPEFIHFSPQGLPANIVKVQDLGRHKIVTLELLDQLVRMISSSQTKIPTSPKITLSKEQVHLYADEWRMDQPVKIIWNRG